jgi:hypothetical protein
LVHSSSAGALLDSAHGAPHGDAASCQLRPALSRAARVAGVMAGRGSVSFKEPPSSNTSDAVYGSGMHAAGSRSADGGVAGVASRVSRSASGRRQQAVMETAACLMAASDSD